MQQFETLLDSLLEPITITKTIQSTNAGTFVPRLRAIVYGFGLDLGFNLPTTFQPFSLLTCLPAQLELAKKLACTQFYISI